jgi:hypothetical protein
MNRYKHLQGRPYSSSSFSQAKSGSVAVSLVVILNATDVIAEYGPKMEEQLPCTQGYVYMRMNAQIFKVGIWKLPAYVSNAFSAA